MPDSSRTAVTATTLDLVPAEVHEVPLVEYSISEPVGEPETGASQGRLMPAPEKVCRRLSSAGTSRIFGLRVKCAIEKLNQ